MRIDSMFTLLAKNILFYFDNAVLHIWNAIWYNLHNLKNVKSTHGGVLLLVK